MKKGRSGFVLCQATVYLAAPDRESGTDEKKKPKQKVRGLILVWAPVDKTGKPASIRLTIERLLPAPTEQAERNLTVSGG